MQSKQNKEKMECTVDQIHMEYVTKGEYEVTKGRKSYHFRCLTSGGATYMDLYKVKQCLANGSLKTMEG